MYQYCSAVENKCVYKGLFPPTILEVVEYLFLIFASAIATICGVGGGAVYSAFMMMLQGFEAYEAFPTTNAIIMFTSTTTLINRILEKKKDKNKLSSNYEIGMIFCPCMIIGVKFGSIINKFCNPLLLLAYLIYLNTKTNIKNYKNVFSQREKERRKKIEESMRENDAYDVCNISYRQKPTIDEALTKDTLESLEYEAKMFLDDEQRSWKIDRVAFMMACEILLLIEELLAGNSYINSLLGIEMYSLYYWLIILGFVLIMFGMIAIAYKLVESHYLRGKKT